MSSRVRSAAVDIRVVCIHIMFFLLYLFVCVRECANVFVCYRLSKLPVSSTNVLSPALEQFSSTISERFLFVFRESVVVVVVTFRIR